MSSTIRLCTTWLVLMLGLFCTTARSDPLAFVTFYGLDVQLFDLNAADGITPQMTLVETERFGSASQYSLPESSSPPLRETHIFDSGGIRLADTDGASWVVMLNAFIEAGATSTGGGAYAAAINDSFTFTLTPRTRAVFSSLTESFVTAVGDGSAIAVVGLTGNLNSVVGQFVNFEAFNVMTESGRRTLPVAVETASGDEVATGDISLRGNVYANSALPIPEPGQYGMLLAGLTLFAVTSWRARPSARLAGLRHRCRCRARPHLAGLAVACGLGAIAAPGLAHASSGSASVRNFSYQLIDLAPADGVTPSLTFTSAIINGSAYANVNNELGNPWDETLVITSYGVSAIEKGPGGASARVAPGSATADAIAWRGAFSAGSSSGYAFILSPNTHAVFSAIAETFLMHDHLFNPPDLSEAYAGLFGEMTTGAGQRTQFDSQLFSPTPGSAALRLAVHAFTGQLPGIGSVRAQAGATAIGVSPIPEPGAWAMLLSGLAFASMRIRRSRRDAIDA
ncbi:hypothetical protein CR105_11070 [Massilia eurypsychrophila]|jgi:hypothetical protein|uniref:Ice-binding protein C-terminal domain-containing protein n=1 Tax=Massilia eurypsychrophila TaxID=1485217 RepID=A0A2G8TG56_9BURK|nr:PEP-CTERM sorting domain-containing protein [Massilia eurypsychrophila]PIL45004.1 hypothetical protein CR105_11070 [Massilia eurypsychrophila]